MDNIERKNCMRMLEDARRGDVRACEALTRAIAKHFFWMIRKYNSPDPAFDRDDLVSQFQLGIWQAIPAVDGRGDPLYHLAWRGKMAVKSMLTVIKHRRYGTEQWLAEHDGEPRSIGTIPEDFELPDPRPEAEDVAHELLTQEAREEAKQHVAYLREHTGLTQHQHQLLEWMLTERVGVDAKDANVRLAQIFQISPQAASVRRRKVLERLGMSVEPTPVFACLRCGGEFRSKGALTQHQRGQSGHRPCPATT